MNVATVTKPKSLAAAQPDRSVMEGDDELTIIEAPREVLRSALTALSEGRVWEVMERFDDRFTFNDHALTLEFTDKLRLTEFFEKSRELFPDAILELVSLFESGDHAFAEWKLAATQTMPYGSQSYLFPISLRGSTIIGVENGKIVQWSDYYDENTSRRIGLAGLFTEWFEY